MTNGIDTQFHALQIEVRRRLSNGLLVQGSYQFGKALANAYGSSAVVAIQPRTLRDLNADKGPSPWDIRHAFKADWLYELPIGPGRAFLNGHIPVVSKVLEGWQTGGVARIQSGPPLPADQRTRHLQPERSGRHAAQHHDQAASRLGQDSQGDSRRHVGGLLPAGFDHQQLAGSI